MKKLSITAKSFMLAIFCLCGMITAYAQEGPTKPNVYIDYFTRSSSVPFLWAENLRNNVIEGIQATNRVELIDVDSSNALRIEQARRESGELSAGDDMERLKVMTQEGANFLITGTVTGMTTTKNKLDDGGYYYTAEISFSLKVINPADGKLVASKSFNLASGISDSFSSTDTPDAAIAVVSGKAKGEMSKLMNEAFKLQGTILEISKVKKDKAEEVYISLGEDNGVAKDDMFDVCVERIVAGRTSQKVIGEIKVKAVEGADISLCEVKKGGEEIKSAMDGGQTIIIKSKPKKDSIFKKAGSIL